MASILPEKFGEMPYLKKATLIWLGMLLLAIVLLSFGYFMDSIPTGLWNGAAVATVFGFTVAALAIRFWYRTFVSSGIKEEQRKNPYRKMFFNGVNTLSVILLAVGLTGAFLLLFSGDDRNHAYEAMGLVIIVIWAVIFLRFFIWAVYFYNINHGLTDKDWESIFKAREDRANGVLVDEEQVQAPKYNPYRSQTFGLPPGTVRGMIAFTLLFGAISMLVVSMGMDGSIDQDSFFWDHFEFYKTAFLMMIAFYFGDRSLKYLQKRWPQQGKRKAKLSDSEEQPADEVAEDDAEFASDNYGSGDTAVDRKKFSPSNLKDILGNAEAVDLVETDDARRSIGHEFVHVNDLEFQKELSKESIDFVAAYKGIEPAVLNAIVEVESAGSGFLSNGKPKILFEGHKFYYWLKEFLKNSRKQSFESYLAGNEDILYPSWTRKFYLGGVREYERFQKAYNIHPTAAIYATSWGLFQILGENFNPVWGYCKTRVEDAKKLDDASEELNIVRDELASTSKGDRAALEAKEDELENLLTFYKPIDQFPQEFIEMQAATEVHHLLDFITFIERKSVKYTSEDPAKSYSGKMIGTILKRDPAPGEDLADYNWEAFAYGYNGKGFRKNNYHIKMQKAYEKYKQA